MCMQIGCSVLEGLEDEEVTGVTVKLCSSFFLLRRAELPICGSDVLRIISPHKSDEKCSLRA